VSVVQIAIAWVAAQGDDIVPFVGARRRDQLTQALGALEVTLTQDDLARIESALPKRGRRRRALRTANDGASRQRESALRSVPSFETARRASSG
jgi:diketogulonate reductase-like aldo/keto reductase